MGELITYEYTVEENLDVIEIKWNDLLVPTFFGEDESVFDEADEIIEGVFTSDKSMREQNANLILSLCELKANNRIDLLTKIMDSSALNDFAPSLLKSILIATNEVKGIDESRQRVESILNKKMK